MIFSQPNNSEKVLPYTVVKIRGCSEEVVDFQLLKEQPLVGKRRYGNKILVHECVQASVEEPLDIKYAEFLATSDSCYKTFEIYKTSDEIPEEIPATITFEYNDDDLVTNVLVQFNECGRPPRMAYRLYGYIGDDETRILLSNGNIFITPCDCAEDCRNEPWTDVNW